MGSEKAPLGTVWGIGARFRAFGWLFLVGFLLV